MNYEMNLANFNLTFGSEKQPMLDYFDDLVYTAFIKSTKYKSYIYKKNGISYQFTNIKKEQTEFGAFLTGFLYRTSSESHLLDNWGWSMFCIRLKDHKLAYIKNNWQSPSLKIFNSATNHILRVYKNNVNKYKRLNFELNIIGLPDYKALEGKIRNAKKVNEITLSFFYLNGEDNPFLGNIDSSLGKKIQSTIKKSEAEQFNLNVKNPNKPDVFFNSFKSLKCKAGIAINYISSFGNKKIVKNNDVLEKLPLNHSILSPYRHNDNLFNEINEKLKNI